MWVIQEIALAQGMTTVRCGHLLLKWAAVQKTWTRFAFIQAVRNTHRTFHDGRTMVKQPALLFQTPGQAWEYRHSLSELLNITSERKASEPRDHVFALLGLVPEDKRLQVDYSLPLDQVYQMTMISIFREKNSLDWLHYAQGGDMSTVPSWCIDFSKTAWTLESKKWDVRPYGFSGAGSGRELEFSHNASKGTIRLHGTILGQIQHLYNCQCVPLD